MLGEHVMGKRGLPGDGNQGEPQMRVYKFTTRIRDQIHSAGVRYSAIFGRPPLSLPVTNYQGQNDQDHQRSCLAIRSSAALLGLSSTAPYYS